MSDRAEVSHERRHMERMERMEVFNELRMEGKFCDVVLNISGVEISAHKNVLCVCSDYFRTLFTSDWSPPEKRVYNILGVSPHMMQLIVDYAYTLSVPINEDNVEELLAAADQFLVSGLVHACCQFLEDQMCVENCIGIFKLADFYWCPDLRQKAHLFILHHFEQIARLSEE
ncbi:kelch-like protein 10 [Brachyhypopomus gauderio]|uniref:kelch-like protein 10 n=1 Tax=Brachyhypopomus gauderio TaxID=698409 RepID=UPI0040431E1E